MDRLCSIILLLSLVPAWTGVADENCVGDPLATHHYSVNLVPRQPATELHRTWAPLLQRIGRQHGMCFGIWVPKDFPTFERAMHEGETDFIFLNPYHQLMAHKTSGYLPLVRDEESRLAGVLVVHADSPIRTLHQLEGKTLAFPAPNAYVASLLMRALLAKEGVQIKPRYVASHSNVFRAVALGAVDAGGGANTTLEHQPESLQSRLRVLYQSSSYMPHPFSAHPRVDEKDRERVIKGFIELGADSEGRRMLTEIQMAQPVRADFERDYKVLEELGLENFVEPQDGDERF